MSEELRNEIQALRDALLDLEKRCAKSFKEMGAPFAFGVAQIDNAGDCRVPSHLLPPALHPGPAATQPQHLAPEIKPPLTGHQCTQSTRK